MANFNVNNIGQVSFSRKPEPRADTSIAKGIKQAGKTALSFTGQVLEAQQRQEKKEAIEQAEKEARSFAEQVEIGEQIGGSPEQVRDVQQFLEGDSGLQVGISFGPTGEPQVESTVGQEAPGPEISAAFDKADGIAKRIARAKLQGKSTDVAARLRAQKEFQSFQNEFPGFGQEFRRIFNNRIGIDPAGQGARVLSGQTQSGLGGGGFGGAQDFEDSVSVNGVPMSNLSEEVKDFFSNKLASTGDIEEAKRAATEKAASEARQSQLEEKKQLATGEIKNFVLSEWARSTSETIDQEVNERVNQAEQPGLTPTDIRELRTKINQSYDQMKTQVVDKFEELNEKGVAIKGATKDDILKTLKQQRDDTISRIEDKDIQSLLKEKNKVISQSSEIAGWKSFTAVKHLSNNFNSETTGKIMDYMVKYTEQERERLLGFAPGFASFFNSAVNEDGSAKLPKNFTDFVNMVANGTAPKAGQEGPDGEIRTEEDEQTAKANSAGAMTETGKGNDIPDDGNILDSIADMDSNFALKTMTQPGMRSYFKANDNRRRKTERFVAQKTNNAVEFLVNTMQQNPSFTVKFQEGGTEQGQFSATERDTGLIIVPTGEPSGTEAGPLGASASEIAPSDELQAQVENLNQIIEVHKNLGQSVLGRDGETFARETAEDIRNKLEQKRAQQENQNQQAERGPDTPPTGIGNVGAGASERELRQGFGDLIEILRREEGTPGAQSNQTRTILKDGEQRRSAPFQDSKFFPFKDSRGNWTIGFGHKISEDRARQLSEGIDRERARRLLENDVAQARSQARNLLDERGIELPEDKEMAIEQMVFQLGASGVEEFDKMFDALEQEDFDEAGDEILDSDFAEQTPERASRVARMMRN